MRTGRPPNRPGGCVGAVRSYLAVQPGTRREIAGAAGYSRTAVEEAVHALRRVRAPELANLMRGNTGLSSSDRVAIALAARIPLELAWVGRWPSGNVPTCG